MFIVPSLFPFRFRAMFTLNPNLPCEECPDPRALLERRLASLSVRNHQEMTHVGIFCTRQINLIQPLSHYKSRIIWINTVITLLCVLCFLQLFLLVLRSRQLFCRLVLSLQPLPLKLPPAKVLTICY